MDVLSSMVHDLVYGISKHTLHIFVEADQGSGTEKVLMETSKFSDQNKRTTLRGLRITVQWPKNCVDSVIRAHV